MEDSSLNDYYIELNDTDDSNGENKPHASIINTEETIKAEYEDNDFVLIEEMDVDESKPLQFEVITVNEFDDKSVQPIKKRARLN